MTKDTLNIVLYVPSFLPDTIGGRELVVHYLAKSYQKLGHKVRVVGPAGWWKNRKSRFDYPIHRWPTMRGHFKEQVALSELFLDISIYGCDILHAHATYLPGYVCTKLRKIKKVPFILTPHGADIHMVPEVGYGLRLDSKIDSKIRVAVKHADLLTAISASVQNSLLSAGANQDKIRHIPNGVDLNRFQEGVVSKELVCDRLNLPADSKLIITIGRYEPRKGQDILIRAMPSILSKEKSARLVIIGQKTEALNGLIDELGLIDKVRLAGTLMPPNIVHSTDNSHESIDEPDWLVEYCRHSSVYVSASIDEGAEGLSLALLEGMAAGLPVVATNISGNKDVVIDNRNGYIVDPGDPAKLAAAISSVLENDDRREKMSQESKEIIECYGWDDIARQYLDLYMTVI